jgi:putative inorganic carbon (HCO3(-)) transporter
MPGVRANAGYSSVTPSRTHRGAAAISVQPDAGASPPHAEISSTTAPSRKDEPFARIATHGHKFTYAALFAFTLILYARPSEFYPSPVTASIALVVGIITLASFIPTQLALFGTLTVPLPEVKLIGLFTLVALLSVPLAQDPATAWQGFSGNFIRCVVMFVVMVNVVRTRARLNGLLFLAIAAAVWLSVGAVNDYRLGRLTVEGYRVDGRGIGLFGNTIDMALFLVTMVPIVIALLVATRSKILKIILGVCAAGMLAAIVFTYSRGAFLGLLAVFIFAALKLGRRHRFAIVAGLLLMGMAFLFLAPGNYALRMLSILDPSLDPVGSATHRRGELLRSIYVAIRHPLLGIGMDNYREHASLRGLVTHNSYTQVASEMGMVALVIYTLFMVRPLRRLGQISREVLNGRADSRFYYLALGLQASLIAYAVSSFFLSVAYRWYIYYLVGYAVSFRRIYESETGKLVVAEKGERRTSNTRQTGLDDSGGVVTCR